MRKGPMLVGIALTALVGAYLAAGYGQDDRGVWSVRTRLDLIHDQLSGLREHLRRYKAAHGRYPTNDEGLAVLDNFDARFMATFYRQSEWSSNDYRGLEPLGRRFMWELIQKRIAQYRQQHGNVPRSADELMVAGSGLLDCVPGPDETLTATPTEVAIGAGDSFFLLSPAGVLSPWLIPYGYENRDGNEVWKFKDSPANSDPHRRYSVVVDDGVYLYSFAGQSLAQELHERWWQYHGPRFFGGALLAVAACLSVIMIISSWRNAGAALVALLVSGGAGFGLNGLFYATCYVPSLYFYRRDTQAVARQKQLLDQYHSNGVIGDEAYRKILSAIDEGPSTRPASAPAGEP